MDLEALAKTTLETIRGYDTTFGAKNTNEIATKVIEKALNEAFHKGEIKGMEDTYKRVYEFQINQVKE
jgi:hypothetical protein